MATAKKPSSVLRSVLGILSAIFIGSAIGSVIFTIGYSEMPSYLGTDPQTCANCHVMQQYYDSWAKGPHHAVAKCDDCHLPSTDIVNKYYVQLDDGMRHSYIFATKTYPQNIVIRPSSLAVVNAQCLTCHDVMTQQIRYVPDANGETVTCSHCHSTIGHQ